MQAAEHGLKGKIGDRSMHDLAKAMIQIATKGLRRRQRLDSSGNDETGFLDPIRHIAESGITPGEKLLDHFHRDWAGGVRRVYQDFPF